MSSRCPTMHVWEWNEIRSGVCKPIISIFNRMKLEFICFVDGVEPIN